MMIKMKIVVPFFNCEQWIERCLSSIATQQFKDWECVIINDASTDNSKSVLDSLEFLKRDDRFSVIHNESNVKALRNIVDGFNFLKCKDEPDCLMMIIDGDDFLYSDQSLNTIATVYSQYPQLLLTYGDWIGYPYGDGSNCEPYPREVILNNAYRYAPFSASHLRTFKSKLWYAIKDADLRDSEGEYFEAGWDVAFMVPMLEMAQERHGYIDRVMYCYNKENPLSDYKVNSRKQEDAVTLTKSRPQYGRLECK